MGFKNIIIEYENFDLQKYFKSVTDEDLRSTLEKENLNLKDLLNLLSPKAAYYLEEMAEKAQRLTKMHFGKKIHLYSPIYLSNYCSSACIYCGFSKNNRIIRKQLTFEEIEIEAQKLAEMQIEHVLILTGEAKHIANFDYIARSVRILKKYFSSISIEIYPLTEIEYKLLKKEGVDGLTIYQETYDENVYDKVHLAGEKKNFTYRLDAAERGCLADFRQVSIGALYGLSSLEKEAFLNALHANYLMNKYPTTEISVSFPRIRNAEGSFNAFKELDDAKLLQFILAFRLFLPKVGINLSTRESSFLRDNLLGLGVTKISAGSKTSVGGYQKGSTSTEQFEIVDNRSVEEIDLAIRKKGFDPIYKDWEDLT